MRAINNDSWYAIYSEGDKYIAGFTSLREISKYLGHGCQDSFSCLIKRSKNNPIYKYQCENMEYECSQKIYEYRKHITVKDGTILQPGTSIFRFWKEKISEE